MHVLGCIIDLIDVPSGSTHRIHLYPPTPLLSLSDIIALFGLLETLDSVPHSPGFAVSLTPRERRLALRNALRYFRPELHATLAPEFLYELREYGHIFMMRFRPTEYVMRAYPLEAYPALTRQAAAIQMMIMNNLVGDECHLLAPL